MGSTPPQSTPPIASTTVEDAPFTTGESTEGEVKKQSTGIVSDIIDLPSGKELTDNSAKLLATSRPVRWVVVVGPVGCGKTTLLTSLYELFQWSPVAGYLFAGSNTLPAFEQRCYLSRVQSEKTVPETQRSAYKEHEPDYVHMRIGTDSLSPIDLLFTDVSGEMFNDARDSTEECRKLGFLRRAGDFLLLLDSEKGVRLEKQWAMVRDAKMILQSCIDSEMIASDCIINIVWSKFDHFVAAGDQEHHKKFREEAEKEFRESFESRVGHIRFGTIAARPTKAPSLGFGSGVPELLKRMNSFSRQSRDMVLLPQLPAGSRESELFALRHFDTPTK